MSQIKVVHEPDEKLLEEMGVRNWSIWEKDVSEFSWFYSETEICYLLEGEVEVTPDGGKPIKFGKGDLVTFPTGLSCRWKITKDVKKHYKFG